MLEEVVQVHEAVPADIAAVLGLYRDLDQTHEVLDVVLRRRGDKGRREHLNYALKDEQTRFMVARLRKRVIGFVIAGFARRRPDVVIEALAVCADFRRRGVGANLVQDVEQWAKTRRARFVELGVFEFNPEARAFYEALGYLTTSRIMRRDPSFNLGVAGHSPNER